MNIEERKKIEAEYYDRRVEEKKLEKNHSNGFNPLLLGSYKYLYDLLKKYCKDKVVLDYGCGSGIHSVFPLRVGAKRVTGIDLSVSSLKLAIKKAEKEGVSDRAEFLEMDCENLNFPDNSFDVILDGGTFSSLDLRKSLPELARILKPDGVLLGIETFGHNPLTNLKRKLNKITGRRTAWAHAHIFNKKYLELAKSHFNEIDIKYFHIISWVSFPFINMPGGKILLELLEKTDRALENVPFFRNFAFKVVFIFSNPKK